VVAQEGDRPPPPLRRGIVAVAEDVRDEWTQLRSVVAPEGTVTIFFSDIEGWTSLNERIGDLRAQDVLKEHYRIVRDELVTHRGFEVKVHGDGFMIAFDSAARALRCAQAIQRAQTAWTDAHPDTPLRVRMGLHTGEAIRDADDFLGSTVNLASRIATAARGGEILVSSLLKELCASTGEFDFDRGQEIDLKGLSQPHKVFSVSWSA
jgi:class 3 adenylate cyclase